MAKFERVIVRLIFMFLLVVSSVSRTIAAMKGAPESSTPRSALAHQDRDQTETDGVEDIPFDTRCNC